MADQKTDFQVFAKAKCVIVAALITHEDRILSNFNEAVKSWND